MQRPFKNRREKEASFLKFLMKERDIKRKSIGKNAFKDVQKYKEKNQLQTKNEALDKGH